MSRLSKTACGLALLLSIGSCVRATRAVPEDRGHEVIARDEAGGFEVRRLLSSPLTRDAGWEDAVQAAIARAESTCIFGEPGGDAGGWISASDLLDPGGAGFFLNVRDGGDVESIYTGLVAHGPYVLCQPGFVSVGEGSVTVEARHRTWQQRDASGSGAQRPREVREPTPLAMTFDLSVLRRDSDHDGLTDIEETRLLTDPLRSDTDGDGRPDAEDVNPLASFNPTEPRTDRAEIREKAMALALGGPRREATRRLVLLEGWEPFDVQEAPYRLLTLSPVERAAYESLFGQREVHELHIRACASQPCATNPFGYPLAVEPFVEGMSYAIVQISGDSWGNTYEARRADGGWELKLKWQEMAQR